MVSTNYGPPQVKWGLLISNIFYVMNILHFSEMPGIRFQHFQRMSEMPLWYRGWVKMEVNFTIKNLCVVNESENNKPETSQTLNLVCSLKSNFEPSNLPKDSKPKRLSS